jgi:hypothetical protein
MKTVLKWFISKFRKTRYPENKDAQPAVLKVKAESLEEQENALSKTVNDILKDQPFGRDAMMLRRRLKQFERLKRRHHGITRQEALLVLQKEWKHYRRNRRIQ